MSKLPPWTGNDAAMQRSLDDKLDELLKEDGAKARARRRLPLSREEKEALFPEDSDEGVIAAAERGDIGPLRRRLPKFARFLRLPRRERGQRYLKDKATKWKEVLHHPHDSRLALAVIDVSRIRAIWQKHFRRKNRSKYQGEKSAEHFAAERWGVTEDEVSDAMRIECLRPPE
jgi:hypothetical protein